MPGFLFSKWGKQGAVGSSSRNAPALWKDGPMPNPLDDDDTRTLAWAHGQAQVQRWGAMLGPIVFRMRGRADFQPMHVAPWADEPGVEALPALLRHLRGEWPCVPFGRVDALDPLPQGWTGRRPDDEWGHGYASHHAWDWLPQDDPHALALAVAYPESSPVRRLVRTIRAVADAPALELTLRIEARRPCTLPVALHPTLRLDLGRVALRLPHRGPILAYPADTAPDVSRLARGAAFADLARAPARDGGELDLTRFPLPADGEELVQAMDVTGPVELAYLDQGWTVRLDWDRAQLPDAMLWISHRGRRGAPWNGRHLALGVEPVNGPFDLGRIACPGPGHPLAGRQGVALDPAHPTTIRCTLGASWTAP